MKTSTVKHYFINEEKIKDSHLAAQLKINHALVLGSQNIAGYFDKVDDALKNAYRNKERFVVLHWQSSYFELGAMGRTLVEYENLFDYEHPIYAHLIDNQIKDNAGWYGFVPVTVALDLDLLDYKNEEEIQFGDIFTNGKATIVNAVRSVENIHDRYTPIWLRKDEGTKILDTAIRPGWAIINRALEKNLEVLSLDGSIRKLKTSLFGTDHSDDFLMMSQLFENIGILENSTMAEWFLRTISNNQQSKIVFEIINEEFIFDAIEDPGKNVVIYPALKDIAKISDKVEKIYIITESKDEFSKMRFLLKDREILEKYGYSFDPSKCTVILEDIFKNKNKFIKFCKNSNIDTIYIQGLMLRRNNIGLSQSVNYLVSKLKNVNFKTYKDN